MTASAATVLALGLSLASPPPANTIIGNRAAATYLDPSGTVQPSSSNDVFTTVEQIGAYVLNGDNTKPAAPGYAVPMPHTLTNLGNGPDVFDITVTESGAGVPDFARIAVYEDSEPNQLPDDISRPLCMTPVSGAVPDCVTGFSKTVAGNGTFNFVVMYTVPGTATVASWPTNSATVTARPNAASPILSTYDPTTIPQIDTDTVNLTLDAAFTVGKSLKQPAVAAPGGGAWPGVAQSGPASSVGASCPTTWSPGLTTTPTCTYAVYTLDYSNNGGNAGSLAIRDALPSGMTYVDGSAVWSSAGGTALTDPAAGDPAGISYEYDAASREIRATIASVGDGVTGSLSFVVLINETAAVGTSTTSNVANFSGLTCADPLTCANTPTNASPFTVVPTYGVVTAGVSSTTPDDIEDDPTKSGDDLIVQPSVAVNGSVAFPVIVTNTGNSTETFNVVVDELTSTFPAGTRFTLLNPDGTTALLPTGGSDAIPDTGPLAAGNSFTVIVQARLDSTATVGTGPHEVKVTARSTNDTSGSDRNDDSAWLRVLTVSGSLVDLTNTTAGTGAGGVADGDLGPGPSPLPTTTNTTQAGTGTTFPLFVSNNDVGFDNVFRLSASQTPSFPGTLPAGWAVTFHAAGGACGSPTITDVAVTAGAQVEVVACVLPPINANVGTQNVYFQAESTGTTSIGVAIRDAKLDAVIVQARDVAQVILDPDHSGQVSLTGSTTYRHTLRNVGTLTCGAFDINVTTSDPLWAPNWSLFLDDGTTPNEWDAADTQVTGPGQIPALAPGDPPISLLLRVFAPGTSTIGAQNTHTLTAVDTSGVCADESATDITTVVTGLFRLYKTQAADLDCNGQDSAPAVAGLTLRPGNCLVYEVLGRNEGAAPINNVNITDAIPTYTNYEGKGGLTLTQPANQCTSTLLTGTAVTLTTTGTPVTSLKCGSAANTLAPGGTVLLRFSVQLDPIP